MRGGNPPDPGLLNFMRNLSELLALHNDLDEIFFAQQRALLYFDFDTALSLLERYETGLLTHMKDEEEVLLPIYNERATVIKGGNAQLFLDEHEKMRGWIVFFKEQIARLAGEPYPEADLILLLDREAFYKRLSSHHDKRETEVFYPELDRITSETEKLELLNRVTRTFSLSNAGVVSQSI